MTGLTYAARLACTIVVVGGAVVAVGLLWALGGMIVEDTRAKLAERKAQQRWLDGTRRTKSRW